MTSEVIALTPREAFFNKENQTNLIHIVQKESDVWAYNATDLDPVDAKNNKNVAWDSVWPSAVKSLMDPGYLYLEEGDIIKIGRVRFKLGEVQIEYNDDYGIDKPHDIIREG